MTPNIYKQSNLSKYIDELHERMKANFEFTLNKIYIEEIEKYKEVIEIITKLPFVQCIIQENNELKEKIKYFESITQNNVKLEISDKSIETSYLDIEKIKFNDKKDDEEEEEEEDEEAEEEDEEEEDEEEEEEQSADEEEEEEQSADEEEDEEEEEEQSADEEEDEEEEEEQSVDEEEFKCEKCSTVQGNNNCELCNAENVCEECHGQGGDYGPNEIWVCNECLPICNGCEKKLYSAIDECCGKGRSDIKEVYYQKYKCSKCSFITTCDDPDCTKCKKKSCMLAITSDTEEEKEKEEEQPSADEEEEEQPSADEEEEEQPSADEEEEEQPSADEEEEEETSPTFPKKNIEIVEEPSADEEEEEVFEIEIDGTSYYCNNEDNGNIYADDDGEVGDIVGKITDGEASFFE